MPEQVIERTIVSELNAWKEKLQIGLTGEAAAVVDAEHTAVAMGSGTLPVFATPAMAALMEAAAVNALAAVLPQGQTSVGVALSLEHEAATPMGVAVRTEARLIKVDGRRLTFRVVAYDAVEQIGVGTHQRVVVEIERFLGRTAAKGQGK